MTVVADRQTAPAEPEPTPARPRWQRILIYVLAGLLLATVVEAITGVSQLASAGTFGSTLRLAIPILLAALGGMFSERAGVVNIGLEGMMIMGTWFAAWGALEYGPWWGVVLGLVGGALGGLLHAIATVTFNVDHIVSGVAINILALGAMRFLSVVAYADLEGGGATQSPRAPTISDVDLPFLSGGNLFGWDTPDFFGWLERKQWLFISDIAGLGRGLTGDISWLAIIGLLLVPLTWFVLWRTAWGLRLRSVGENPWAAESLGIAVLKMKYWGVLISGALAGLGGAFLVLVQATIYREGQTGGRGFIGLATLIFGNWRPTGSLGGALLFGFADALRIRDPSAVRALFLYAGLAVILLALVGIRTSTTRRAGILIGLGVVLIGLYLLIDVVPNEFTAITPYVVTLLVLAFASQRLRMPAADGARYRKGESH